MRIRMLSCMLILAMMTIAIQASADSGTRRLMGRIYDKNTNEGIPFASIYIIDSGLGVMSDVDGNYSIAVTVSGDVSIRISSVGYSTCTISCNVAQKPKMDIPLSPQSVALEDVTVTAKYNDKVGSDATIDQEALEYIQPVSIQDVFQLLPGGTLGSNNMQGRKLATSRQVGSDAATAFGMGITMDGIPMHNDGQRVQMSGFTGVGSVDNEGNKSVNTGMDMRSISTDHIETITVSRGIASAKEGNISSGNIRVTQKQGQSPLRIRLKFDPLNKLAYVGKGLRLPGSLGTLYLGTDIVRSATSTDDTRGAYNRITVQANWNNKQPWFGKMIDMSLRAGYVTSFNNNKSDDIIEANREDYSTRYQRFTLSTRLNAELNWLPIDALEFMASADYTTDLLKYNKRVVNNTVTPMQNLSEEGEHEGEYLPVSYHTFYKLDDKPLNLFGQLTASKYGNITPRLDYSAILGTSISYVKNLGMGAVVDPSRPPYPSSDFIRPRPNKDIPALVNHAGYAELRLNWRNGPSLINTQFGIRETMMLNLPSHYALHGRMLWEPRLQMAYTYNFHSSGGESQINSISIRGGYGVENKLPSADYLYPDKVYHDFVALNAYFSDPGKRLLLINTKIEDPSNPNIRENRNRKVEVGLDFKFHDYVLSLTGFKEKMDGGIQYFLQYTPASYTYYYELKHEVDQKPTRDDFYSRQRTSFMQLKLPMNSAEVTKTGIETAFTFLRSNL